MCVNFFRNMITFWHKQAQGYDKRRIKVLIIGVKGFVNSSKRFFIFNIMFYITIQSPLIIYKL